MIGRLTAFLILGAGAWPATAAMETADDASLPRRIADLTRSAAEGVVGQFERALDALSALNRSGGGVDWAAFGVAALNLGAVIVATVAVFLLLRWLARGLFGAASGWALGGEGGMALVRRCVAVLLAGVVDVTVIALAWVSGYAVALFVVGDAGGMATEQSLFLNAFLVIEVFKAVLRMLFASRYEGLRIMPLAAADAARWNGWLAGLVGFVGYGLMLVVPVLNASLTPAIGDIVTPLIMLLAFIHALRFILDNRASVRAGLERRATESKVAVTRVLAGLLARTWHYLAIAYFAALALVTVTRPGDALPFMALATVQSLAVIAVGLAVSSLVLQWLARPVSLSPEMRDKVPGLEARLNGFIPKVVNALRLLLIVLVVAALLDAWDVIVDLRAWIASEAGGQVISAAVSVAFIVVAATALWVAAASWIELRLNPDVGSGEPAARERTLLILFRNAVAIVIVTMTIMISLSQIGIDIGPLIAGAGVLGLAVGFGAQKLVQDIITGVFIQLENAINTGDVITAAGITGTAERLSIRSVGVRDLSGTFHIVPFSSVDTVSNFNRDFAYHVGVYGVAYREDTDEVIGYLQAAFEELRADPAHGENILDDLEVHGVTELADSSVNVRVRIKTRPGTQWALGRAYNRLVKRHLDAAGVEIPFPHMTLYFGEDKAGNAPPANLRLLEGQSAPTIPRAGEAPGPTDADRPKQPDDPE